ncbi:MAG: HAMP domain-containing histidine kinase [Deltaproteobacteria bacterium]|nr:HAMP domain-containing histidine kinase [Deltaproteobacteria bacterium]
MAPRDDDEEGALRKPSSKVSLGRIQAVSVSPLRQLSELLSALLFEETENGVMPRSTAAQKVLGLAAAEDLADALARATGLSPTGPSIGELLERAKVNGGAAGSLRAASGAETQVAIQRLPSGRHLALLVRSSAEPQAPNADAELVRQLATANHEMANTMAAVDALAARALAGVPDAQSEALTRIRSMISRALDDSRATRRALAGGPAAVELLEVDGLLHELGRTLEPLALAAEVELVLRITAPLHAELPRVPVRSVVFNLVKNAIEACHPGGRVSLSASGHGPLLRLVVADDGAGMDEHLRERVFDPYFTTKEEGSGLGLSLVQSLVGRMKGEVLLETRLGHGSRFVISLPRGDLSRSVPISGVRAKRDPNAPFDADSTQKIKIPSGGR